MHVPVLFKEKQQHGEIKSVHAGEPLKSLAEKKERKGEVFLWGCGSEDVYP